MTTAEKKAWACPRCTQLNSWWAADCGRCGHSMRAKEAAPASGVTEEQIDAIVVEIARDRYAKKHKHKSLEEWGKYLRLMLIRGEGK